MKQLWRCMLLGLLLVLVSETSCNLDCWCIGCTSCAADAGAGGAAPAAPPDTCCKGRPKPYNFVCSVSVVLPCPGPGACPSPPGCTYRLEECFDDLTEATIEFQAQAEKFGGPRATLKSNGFALCTKAPCPQGRRKDPPLGPLDDPLCISATTCAADSESCTYDSDCCSGLVCSDQGSCESCRMDGEGCAANGDCCSGLCSDINTCSTTCDTPPCPVPPPPPRLDGGV
jgi:hypothetical protein